MDEIEKLLEAANAGLRKAVEAAYEAGRQAGKREVFSALTAAAGVEPPVKRRKRRTKAEMGKE